MLAPCDVSDFLSAGKSYVDQCRTTNVVRDLLERELQSVHKQAEFIISSGFGICATMHRSRKISSSLLVLCLLFRQESSQGDNIGVDSL
jgi:hypothetical protein